MSKLDAYKLGFDASLIEAAKKCCVENDPYNPTGAGPARFASEPGGSVPDAMTNKISISDEKKKKTKEGLDITPMPGFNKSIK